jgi:succinate dehydrogenase / fumarate reductase cytochrome b subunit
MAVIWSSVARKLFNGITGLMLATFVLVHLIGNLALYVGPEEFNSYSHFLLSLGGLLIAFEVGLVTVILIHIICAVCVWLSKQIARPKRYSMVKSAGGASHKTFSSVTMIYTGILILLFLVLHIKNFKYGPNYIVSYEGQEMRDLYRLVVDAFSQLDTMIFYVAIMILLGFHLRHGFWSAFQSLGMTHPKYSPIIYAVGYIFAVFIAVGFLAIPIWIYFTGGIQ